MLKIGQNIKYDINVLARYGIAVAPVDDTMIISFALDSGRAEHGIGGGHGMDELSGRHLGHTPLSFKEICGTGKKQISFGEAPLDRATEYAAEDADVTWRLHRYLKPRLSEEGGTRIYERVDRPLIPVVAAMEREGIKVDRARLAKLSKEFAGETARLESEIHELAGQEFTVGSPKQLGEILFDKLGYKGGRKGKSGQYSTDQNVLERLALEGADIAKKVLEWRQLAKLKSTYTDALQEAINPKTGRVYRSELAKYSRSHSDWQADPRGICAGRGQCPFGCRLFTDRAPPGRTYGRCPYFEGGIRRWRRYPRTYRYRAVR